VDAGKSYSRPGSRLLEALQHHGRYAPATVSQLKRNLAIAKGQSYLRARTLRVTMDIGERFLKNAKKSNFDFLRQTRKTGWQVQGNCNPATLGKTLDVPGGGGKKTDFVCSPARSILTVIVGAALDQTGAIVRFLATPCDEDHAGNEECEHATRGTVSTGQLPKAILPENVRKQLRQRLVRRRDSPLHIAHLARVSDH
jgi:hypothetical protein